MYPDSTWLTPVRRWKMASIHLKHPPPKTAVCSFAMGIRCAELVEVPLRLALDRDRERCLCARNWTIQRVALNRLAARLGNQPNQILPPHPLRGGRARIVIDLLLDHSPIDVICSETQRNLRNLRRHHLPVRLDVRKIIEHETADSDLLDVEHAGGSRQMLQRSVRRMERQWDESLEAAGLILQSTQLQQVIDSILIVLDVSIEHGGIGFEADLMSQPRRVEPLVAINLVIANDVPHAVGENLGSPARQRIHTRLFHLDERLTYGKLRALCKVGDLYHGEGLHVHLRETFLQSGNQVEKI